MELSNNLRSDWRHILGGHLNLYRMPLRLQGHPERMLKLTNLENLNFYKKKVFSAVPGRKIATNYSPTPSISLRNVLRLPSKAAPPMLADWKSASRSPKRRSWQVLPGPQSTQRAHILGENSFCIPIMEKFSFDPNSDLSAGLQLSSVNTEQSVTFVKILIRMNVRIYSYQQNYTNEYPNIFILILFTQTNVRISIRIENCTNIRIYSNIRLGFTL